MNDGSCAATYLRHYGLAKLLRTLDRNREPSYVAWALEREPDPHSWEQQIRLTRISGPLAAGKGRQLAQRAPAELPGSLLIA